MFDIVIPGKYNMTLIWNKHMNFFIKISRETQVLQNNFLSKLSFNSDWIAHLMMVALTLYDGKGFSEMLLAIHFHHYLQNSRDVHLRLIFKRLLYCIQENFELKCLYFIQLHGWIWSLNDDSLQFRGETHSSTDEQNLMHKMLRMYGKVFTDRIHY